MVPVSGHYDSFLDVSFVNVGLVSLQIGVVHYLSVCVLCIFFFKCDSGAGMTWKIQWLPFLPAE